MAIKERLLKQLNIVRDGLRAMPPFHSRDLNTTRKALVQARDLCFQGLPSGRFNEYQDTYDGILLAIDQLAASAADSGEIASLCQDLLQYLSVQTQKETVFKKEIFFLPYKASMWDSLESVWKAADEDKEHCIAYVMPIPYADLTPEHTVAEWHCERGLFPKDVPTIDWQTVDLAEIHPDVIFIHNPYDECNRVTSVESRFYSSVLKNQTDKLVYIPYFVLGEPEFDYDGPEKAEKKKDEEEKIAHFILKPGVMNADEVIVQSEAMKNVYVNVLSKHTNADREYWEKHIKGSGSPKLDKVINTKKDDYELPEEWEKLIKGRKCILYNTGINAMLEHPDIYIYKIKSVLMTFKEKENVVLWWRPHPLLRSTFQAMHPELLEEYDEIVSLYRQEGWGIYDDTAELGRAIEWTDGYYGDWSSVVHLYKAKEKPVMIQTVELFISSQ